MKMFRKKIHPNGHIHIYFCGVKLASYKQKNFIGFISGTNNQILNFQSTCNIQIYGNNNKIVFGKNLAWHGDIFIGLPDLPANNCSVIIGDGSSSNGVTMRICEDGTNITIGSDCMFSSGVTMWASDTHTITDLDGEITNVGKYIKVGNHVWVSMGATILKNTTIADNCVVGTQAVVGGIFDKTNCIIAGNPAKIVKENTNWDRRRPGKYIQET